MNKCVICCAAVVLSTGLFAAPATGWLQTAAGTYDYNDTANWVDGDINGVFGSDLTLAGAQTIVFRTDTTLTTGMSFRYNGKYAITFMSDAKDESETAIPATLTLGGDIEMDTVQNDGAVIVNFGTSTAANALTVNLGGETRTVSVADGNTFVKFQNKVENGGLVLQNTGKVVFNATDNTYAGGTTLSGTGYVYVQNNCFGTGAITFNEGARLEVSGGRTFTANNPLILNGRLTSVGTSGSLDLGAGDITITKPLTIEVAKNTLTLKGALAANSPCGPDEITKVGVGILNTSADCTVSGMAQLTVDNGTWNFNGALVASEGVRVSGGAAGTATLNLSSGRNSFAGVLEVAGSANYLVLGFTGSGALPEGVTVKLSEKAMLKGSTAYSCGYYLANNIITADSVGVLALGSNESADLDLSAYPNLAFGAASAATYSGRLTPCGGVYRFVSTANLTLSAENSLTGTNNVEISGAGELMLSNVNDLSGTITVASDGKLRLMNATGALPAAKVVLEGGTLNLTSSAACDVVRAGEVVMRSGTIWFAGHKSYHVCHRLTSITLEPRAGVGGTSQILYSGDNGKGVHLHIGKINRPSFAMLNIATSASTDPGLGLNDITAAGFNVTVGEGVENLGEGTAGTVQCPIVPWVRQGSSFVYYDAERGFRPLATAEREAYTAATTIEAPAEGANLFFNSSGGGTLTLTGSAPKVNTISFGYQGKSMSLNADSIIDVLGAAVTMEGNASPYLNASINFGTNHGYIAERKGKAQCIRGAISGSNGLTIANWTTVGVDGSSGGTGLLCEFKDSTFTGDIHAYGRLDAVMNGCFPYGERSGGMYLHGLWMAGNYDISLNGLNGKGELRLANGYNPTFTLGCDGTDGDFGGGINRSNGTLSLKKVGAGRQRFGGTCAHNGTTVVEAGVLQNDGSFTLSTTTVATGATLAGSGSFSSLVTLADGTSLEAGSKLTDARTLRFDGGLVIGGSLTLDLVYKDNVTLGSVAVAGAVTIPDDCVVTVNVLKGATDRMKGRSLHTILTSTEGTLQLAKFKRGSNCGPLSLSSDGTALNMAVSDGLAIVVR